MVDEMKVENWRYSKLEDDCRFCKYYIVQKRKINGFLSEIIKRGCSLKDIYVPDFEIKRGLDCLERAQRGRIK